jgi:phosphatidylglycerophosphate synthase
MRRAPTIDELRRVCQPPEIVGRRSEEHWTGRLYMRRLSLHVTRTAIGFGVSANGVTWIMLTIGIAGAAVLGIGGVWPASVTAVAMHLFALLDASDGEVARWNGTQGATGIYLDRVAHYSSESVLFAALGWRAAAGETGEPWMLLGLVAALGVVFARLETDLVDSARAKAGLAAIRDEGGEIRPRSVRTIRRVADFLPIHRLTGAVEMSLLMVAVAVVDAGRGDLLVTRGALIALTSIAWLVVVGHLVSILASDRLR